jgi:PAS domain S-box-containing protein
VIATDSAGRVIFLNAVAQSLTGWTQEEAAGQPLDKVFVITNEDTGATVQNPVSRALREGRAGGLADHTQLTAKTGKRVPIDDSAAPIRDANGKVNGVVLVFRDVAEKRATERLEKKAAAALGMVAAIVESSEDAILSFDLQGSITSWNRGAEKLFGYDAGQVIGQPVTMLAPDRTKDIPEALQLIRRREPTRSLETIGRHKSGREVPIWLTISPIRDHDGETTGVSAIIRDISDRVAAEKERARQLEFLARSNADLQQFAYAASHDLREPLRTITSFCELLQVRNGPQLDEQGAEFLKFIISGTGRMSQLVDGLLEYARSGEITSQALSEIDTEKSFENAIEALQLGIQDSGAAITHDPLPSVPGHEIDFSRLFQNLIGNAIKYRRDEALRIHVSAKQSGDEWIFSVSDNGQGIPAQQISRIFRLFSRLHGQEYPGAGIGLAMCQKIVERNGGRIWVESEVGKGSTFFFTVPVQAGVHQSAASHG